MSLVSIVPFRDLTSFNVFPTAYLYLYQQLYVNSYWNVGCYCLVAKLCPNRWDTMDCSPPDSSVHGISHTRILEWVTFSRGFSWPRDRICISCIGRWILYHWATWEAQYMLPIKKVKVKSLSHVRLFATPWAVAYQAPLSMGFSR